MVNRNSDELDLLICSAEAALPGAAASETAFDDVQRLCRAVDWDVVTRLAWRHEIAPLVWSYWQAHCATFIPTDVMARFRLESRLAQMRAKTLTAALLDVLDAFGASGIRGIPFKGVVLAEQAFGSASARICGDVDIILPPTDVRRADAIMQALGYKPESPALPQTGIAEFLSKEYHITYVREDGRAIVEVHWNFGHDRLRAALDVRPFLDRAIPFPFAGRAVPALAPEDLLVILCLHGAKHGWDRLKWVFDIAGLLRRHPQLDLEAVDRLAETSGCRKMVALGLQLAADPRHAELRELWTMEEVPMLSIVGVQLRTRDTLRERWRIARPFQPSARDREVVALPESLEWLYFAIRPVRLLADYGAKLKTLLGPKRKR
jgi:hypothetical protein